MKIHSHLPAAGEATVKIHTHLPAAGEGIWDTPNAWRIGHYVLMPDHLHLFCSPVKAEFSIEQWITFWKSLNGPGSNNRFHA